MTNLESQNTGGRNSGSQEIKVTLCYIVNFRPVWAVWNSASK